MPSFEKEGGVRLTSATPQAVAGAYPALRMYFLRNFEIRSATSADGLSWTEEPGIRVSTSTTPLLSITSITACSVLALDGGGFRMLYSVGNSTGAFNIVSATSSDGLNWASEVVRIAGSSATILSHPRLLELSNGDWRVYYLKNFQVFTSLSTDEGKTWSAGTVVVSDLAFDLTVSTLTNQRVRLFYASLDITTLNWTVLSALSSSASGDSFSSESGVRLSSSIFSGFIEAPLVVRSTETFRWRMYYGFTAISTPNVHSALTLDPNPQLFSPNRALRSDPPTVFAVTGEIFSTSPSARLTKSGQADIVGTGVSRIDDQTLAVTFDVNQKALGAWSLVVTNADGESGTLANALVIDFAPGEITLTDNLFRPRLGGQTQIDITIFDFGQLSVRVFTLEGRPVKIVSDEARAAGNYTFFWDGKTEEGHTVASGVYLLQSIGPKLDDLQKIVVIK